MEKMKSKVGVLVFTDKVAERGTRKNTYFESFRYTGLRYIISEIEKEKFDVSFVSRDNIKDRDFVLASITSYMDIENLVNELSSVDKGRAKICIGGAGVTNIRLYKNLIDYAVFGRGEGVINHILKGDSLPKNVWSKEDDPNLEKKYKIGEVKTFIGDETSVGCRRKCAFCHYSWKNKYVTRSADEHCLSGYADYEDFFDTFDWEKTTGREVVTALDGVTEFDRKMVNKPFSNKDIINKIREAYSVKTDKVMRVKVYMIIGYPWHTEKDADLLELKETLAEADKEEATHRIVFNFFFTHFVPMSLTPMYGLPLNFIDFYKELTRKRPRMFYRGKNIEAYVSFAVTTPPTAFEELVIERAKEEDYDIYKKVFLSRAYKTASAKEKIKIIKTYAPPRLYNENWEDTVEYLIPFYDYKTASKRFMERKL